jgi:hypothetical protein
LICSEEVTWSERSVFCAFCLSGVFVMAYSILSTIFKHQKNLKALLGMTSVNALVILIFGFNYAHTFGLPGIGWAWLIGTMAAVVVGCMSLAAATKQREVSSA